VEGTDPNGVTGSATVGDDEGTTQPTEIGVDTAEYHERRGSSFFDNRRYVEAEKSYREAIRLDPSYARYFHNLGTALFAQNQYHQAEEAERDAIRLAPNDAEYRNNLGRYLLAQKRYPEAETEFRESLKLSPEQPAFLNDLGRSLYPQGRYADAEEVQRQAIEIVDRTGASEAVGAELHSQFYNNLGDTLFEQGRSDEAVDMYREACRLDPGSARNHNDFGATLCQLGQYTEAEKELREALDIDPGYALFHNNLAAALFALGKYEQAERESRAAVALDNKDTYHHDLGTALFMQQKYGAAESEFRQAVRLNGADARYQNSLGLCLLPQRRFEDAEAAARRAVALDAKNSRYSDNLASILAAHARHAIERENFAEAASALREVLLIRPNDARNHDSLASVLFAANLLPEAEEEQRTAIALAPDTASYHNNLGIMLLTRARPEHVDDPAAAVTAPASTRASTPASTRVSTPASEPDAGSRAESALLRQAREAFQQAVDLDRDNASYKSNLSRVFFAQQRYSDAEVQLREAIQVDPANDAYRTNLAYALFAQHRLGEAEEAYREAARLGQDKGKHYDNLGTVLLASLKPASAEQEYRKAISLAEGPRMVREYKLHLVAALSPLGKYTEAADLLTGMIEEDADNPVYRDALATAHYHLRAYNDAECEERLAISLAESAERKTAYHVNLARILIQQQRLTEAERELAKLDELGTASAPAFGLLGYIMDRNGQVAEAETNYRRSLSLEANVTIRCNLGILLAKNRRFNEAAEESYQALEEAPTAWMPHYALGLLALEQADEYSDDSYYDDGAHHFKQAIGAFDSHVPGHAQSDTRASLHLNLGYAYGKLGQSARALAEFRSAKKISRVHSRVWFTADANMRRYRRREQAAGFQRSQTAVFISLGLIVFLTIGILEWRNRLTSPYLVSLLALGIALFVIAFYLPIVTNIKLGPVSLEKQAVALRAEPPQPLSIPGNSLDTSSEAWEETQLAEAVGRLEAAIGLPRRPPAPDPQATPQETPPLPQPLGARLFGSPSVN
jgi:Flp pilus assembly protein TadD